jgi:hypothetical protein
MTRTADLWRGLLEGRKIPLWLKVVYALFVAVLVPVYTWHHGLANFLWFSNVALLLGLFAVWLESRWLASMQAVSVSLLEMAWIGDFLLSLVLSESLIGLTAYMHDPDHPWFVRGLSLYHLVLPFLLIWSAYRLGYEPRAWVAQTALAWIILPACYFLTAPENNINWVFGPGGEPQAVIPAELYLALVMIAFPLCVYWPTHRLLGMLFRELDRRGW